MEILAQKQNFKRANTDSLHGYLKDSIYVVSKMGVMTPVGDSALQVLNFRVRGGSRIDSSLRLPFLSTGTLRSTSGVISSTASDTVGLGTALAGKLGTGTVSGLAAPSVRITPTAVTGSGTTALRSDGAPGLDTTYAWKWRGIHRFDSLVGVNGTPADVYGSQLEVFGKGRYAVSGQTWPTSSAGGANWGPRDSWLYGISDSGDIGVAGFSRTSDTHWPTNGTIGVAGFVINDSSNKVAWALYGDVQHDTGSTSFGLELAVKNVTTVNSNTTPYLRGAGANGIWLAGGGDPSYGGAALNPSNTAINVVKNDTTWNKGLIFEEDAITGTNGVTGTGVAIEMAKGHEINWLSAAGQGARIRSDVVTSAKDVGMVFGDDSISFQLASGASFAKFTPTATQASAGRNFLTLTGSTGAGGVEFTTKTADASGVTVGIAQFSDVNSVAADKRVAAITGSLGGTTANNRGADLIFYTKNDAVSGLTEAMRVYRNGNVGIGTSAPAAKLSVGTGSTSLFQVNVNGKISAVSGIASQGLFGVPLVVDTVRRTGLVAGISATTLDSTATAGAYEIEVYGCPTTANGTSTVYVRVDWDNNTKADSTTTFSNASLANYFHKRFYVENVPVSASGIRYTVTLTGTIGSAVFMTSITAKRVY